MILLAVIILIIILISVLVALGILNLNNIKKFFSKEIFEIDIYSMTSRDAYDIAVLKAREWQSDAQLSRINSLIGKTDISGKSDNWNLIFVSKNLKNKGYHIIVDNKKISLAEEISFSGTGGELPENIISSKEAITRAHQAPGYENEEIISVEIIYGPDGKQWYWGVKTSKGTARINAK